jgi:hypothetical protein
VDQMIATRRAIKRYDDSLLYLGDDTNDLVWVNNWNRQ